MSFSSKEKYSELLKDPRWQKLRLEVFERDEWACRSCCSKDKTLNAHHIHYSRVAQGPWDYVIDEIITLCDDCHLIEHETFDSHSSILMVSAAMAGFVLGSELEALSDMLTEIGRSVRTGNTEYLLMMIKCRASTLRGKDQ